MKRFLRRWLWQPIRHRYAPAPYAPACPFSVRYRTQDGREYECHAETFTETAVLAETMAEAGIQVTSWGDRNGAPGAISAQGLH